MTGHSRSPTTPAKRSVAASAELSAELRTRLSTLGLRVTPGRLAVLQVVESAQRAMSHAEIEAAVDFPIDRVTLYRTLESFVTASIFAKSVDADRVSRFVSLHGTNHDAHAHFHCDDCGRVFCMETKPPKNPSVPKGFEVSVVDLNVRGHCAECAHQPPRATRAG